MPEWIKAEGRIRRHRRIRKSIRGTGERPRLSVHRSINHLYAQVIDDTLGKALIQVSTMSPDIKGSLKKDGGNVKGAALLGAVVAEKCKSAGIYTTAG
jgi:large subunit ribosomal protein L18